MFENIALALQGVWSHKLRSVLTMLGIIIGIASIITIVATIKGTNDQIKNNLIGAGNNVVTVQLQKDGYAYEMEYNELPSGVALLDEDMKEELEELPDVEGVGYFRRRNWADGVYYRNTAYNGSIYGVDADYLSINSYSISYGRGFTEEDMAEHRKVAILDGSVADSLFQGVNPIGETLEIGQEPFVVVGVAAQKVVNEAVIETLNDYYMYMNTGAGKIFVPIDCWDVLYRYDEPQAVCLKASGTDAMTSVGTKAADLLNGRAVSSTEIAYKADDLLERAGDLQNLSKATNNQLLWIAGISLLVGGIGVMNIMLVSVTERIREIGLKLAIGARQRRILWQFLTEAAVLTTLGGILGVGFGIGLTFMMSRVMGTAVSISIPACVIALVFSMVIGIVFGLVPAVKASRLNPIDALRHE
ncbi:MAG: ABC transporter permease [Oscillospiraceae bacterium]|nr:ABC transporter permease [Oscillospiraceae bacterium]